MSGIAGQYFKQFGLTVAVAVLFSLLVARLITPMMAAYFMKDAKEPDAGGDGSIMPTYLRVLGLVIFAGSIFSATQLPTEFVPVTDEGRSVISIELAPGSTLDDTRDAA